MAETQSTFTISGYDSDRDIERVVEELEGTDGVMAADVDPGSGEAELRLDEDLISEERARATVRDLGYEVE